MEEDVLTSYWQETITQAEAAAENEQHYAAYAFFENIKDSLIDANLFSDIRQVYFDRSRGDTKFKSMHIDAGSVDPTDDSIHLMYIDYDRTEIHTITNEAQKKAYDGLLNFVYNATHDYFRVNSLQSDPVFAFVKQILEKITSCDNIHLYFLSTNKQSRTLAPYPIHEIEIGGRKIAVQTHMFDIEYLYRNETLGSPVEPITIDVTEYVPNGIECLKTKLVETQYSAYLAVLPGQFLSSIYKDYGGRLLESNVRSFLSTRGNVNKGIRATIRDNPDLFFTYNNGIACTADEVETELRGGTLYLTKLRNFQIINGGQTTASLRNTQVVDKVGLEKVFVCMKLTVINENVPIDQKSNMVRMISQYSNTQNKVTTSDLNSNHEFYIKLEQFSRKIAAPNVGNNTYQTYWYFERSRGQYERDQMELTPAKRKTYQMVNPKNQRIRIVDIAKFYNAVQMHPEDVVWGGQVNATRFQKRIEQEWKRDSSQFNEFFFKNLIAQGILFIKTRELVGATDWYKQHSGVLAEITAYTVSKLMQEIKRLGNFDLDWPTIWKNQDISQALKTEILNLGYWIYQQLSDPNREKDNLGEWAKLPRCWEGIQKKKYELSAETKKCLISVEDLKAEQVVEKKEQKRDDAVTNGMVIFELGAAFWEKCIAEGTREGVLIGSDLDDLRSAVQSCKKVYLLPQQVVTRVMKIRQRLEDEGLDVRINKNY